MPKYTEIVSGLRFPEGPIAMPDGSLLLVEIERGTLSRVQGGEVSVVAELGGGPNGAAIGPDGRCYICNNGGFEWHRIGDLLLPGDEPEDYSGGRIEAVDLETGQSTVLYTECEGVALKGPNDIVFDSQGGFYFTDLGKTRKYDMDRGGVYYALTDGSMIRQVVHPAMTPNGVGLSPDGTRLYFAETQTGRLQGYDIESPGVVRATSPMEATIVGLPGHQLFDSLAVDALGNICVATIVNGGITIISPDGAQVEHVATGDPLTTNICFGGADLRTAYLTLSSSGRLVECEWPTPGSPLHFLNA